MALLRNTAITMPPSLPTRFLREDMTLYVDGVIRLAYMQLGGQKARGMSLQPTVLFPGCLSSVQLRGDVGHFFNTFGERERWRPRSL